MTPNQPIPFQRIVVVGVSGSGKTTLAKALSQRLAIPHIELDSLNWEPGWKEAGRDVFRARLEPRLAAPTWVTDGNYGKARDLTWARATALIWLDYPLPLILWRLTYRTVARLVTREHLWNTNYERLSDNLFSRDSIFLWALQSHPRHRREYPLLLSKPEYNHLHVVRLHSPRETQQWLDAAASVPKR
jgi:adenylate kinase family enzyme